MKPTYARPRKGPRTHLRFVLGTLLMKLAPVLGTTPISLHSYKSWLDQSLGISDIHVETTKAFNNKGADQRERMCKSRLSHDEGQRKELFP